MKKLLTSMLILLFLFIAFDSLSAHAVITPHKISTIPATTIYWGLGTFHAPNKVETLNFSKARGFKTAGDSTAIFVSGITTAGILSSVVLNDSAFIVTSSAAADSIKTFWYLIFRK